MESVDELEVKSKVPLSAKVSPEIRDCFDLLLKADGGGTLFTAEEALTLLFTGDDRFLEALANYVNRNITNNIKSSLEEEILSLRSKCKSLFEFGVKAKKLALNLEDELKAYVIENKVFRRGGIDTYNFIVNDVFKNYPQYRPLVMLDDLIRLETAKLSVLERPPYFNRLSEDEENYKSLKYIKSSEDLLRSATGFFYDLEERKNVNNLLLTLTINSALKDALLGLGKFLNFNEDNKDFNLKIMNCWFVRSMNISEEDREYVLNLIDRSEWNNLEKSVDLSVNFLMTVYETVHTYVNN